MKSTRILQAGALALTLLASSVMAAVSEQEAAQLGTTLTPLGGEMAGNAEGTIPAWTGGLSTNAAAVDGKGFLADPFANEQPLFTITAANAAQYKDKLSAGQMAMLQRYPDTYKIPVYPTHRTTSVPAAIGEAAKVSALNTTAVDGGNGLQNFNASRYYAFPIPKAGVEVVWNHVTRYRGGNTRRVVTQATPQTNGSYSLVKFEDEVAFPADMPDLDPAKGSNILLYFKQSVTAPSRLAGNVLLVHETINQVKEPRRAWLYNSGQRRVRRAPNVAYDGPGTAADGQRTSDNLDLYNGAPDKYNWELVGKKELYIPYNSYRIASADLSYTDIIKPGHVDQSLARYELHRVWHVRATLKDGERHIYQVRDFYIDEDTWQIAVVDHYDGKGNLWRVAEAHAMQIYDAKIPAYAFETLYDLLSGRYLVMGLTNEEDNPYEYGTERSSREYTPAALRRAGVR